MGVMDVLGLGMRREVLNGLAVIAKDSLSSGVDIFIYLNLLYTSRA